jgi:nitrite transporter NirC
MPVPVTSAVDEHAEAAVTKARAVRDLPRYLFSSALAGAYVGVAVVLLIAVSAPLVDAKSAVAKLVQGSVFGVALTLVVFAGAELFTGNAMVMLQGVWRRRVGGGELLAVWVASLAGNVAGSFLFAAAVHAGGFSTGPTRNLIASMTASKDALAGPQLFWRAVLCNALVCLAIWMATRAVSDGAKLVVLWWALLAFIGSGFEHSVANATIFSLGALDGSIGWGALARNLAWTVPGNIVGGGLVIGLGYAWLAGSRVAPAPATTTTKVTAAATAGRDAADGYDVADNGVLDPRPA